MMPLQDCRPVSALRTRCDTSPACSASHSYAPRSPANPEGAAAVPGQARRSGRCGRDPGRRRGSVTGIPDVDRRAGNLDQRVEDVRDVERDPDAAVRVRVERDAGVELPVNREHRADEPDRVVHLAERHLDPAGGVAEGVEIARGGVPAAALVRKAAGAGGDVADQLDLVVVVQNQRLVPHVDLDAQAAAPRDEDLRRAGVYQPAFDGDGYHVLVREVDGEPLDLLERPYRLERVEAELAVDP